MVLFGECMSIARQYSVIIMSNGGVHDPQANWETIDTEGRVP
jgi:hypothetical protein